MQHARSLHARCLRASSASPARLQVLRDLILSFSLPARVVGVRRAPLLGREANRMATEEFPSVLQSAHEAAMRGAEWSWKEDGEPLHRMCALLAGLCITFSGRSGGAEAIRKGDAFQGRVQLPFLETSAPAADAARVVWVPHTDEWVVYRVRSQGASVQLRAEGMEGLEQAALLLTKKGGI